MSDPHPKPRRIVPPAMPTPLVAPPVVTASSSPAAPKPRRRRKRALALTLSIIIALLVVQGAIYAYVTATRRAAAERLHNGMMLAHKDSLESDTWLGYYTQGQTYYCLMSFRDDNAFVKDFLKTLAAPAKVLALLVSNKDATPHKVDLAGATLHFADGSTRKALDSGKVLLSATRDRRAAALAFATTINAPPGEQVWGKVLFIPPDTDLKQLVSVTLKVDDKEGVVKGSYRTEQEKKDMMLESFRQKQAEKK